MGERGLERKEGNVWRKTTVDKKSNRNAGEKPPKMRFGCQRKGGRGGEAGQGGKRGLAQVFPKKEKGEMALAG